MNERQTIISAYLGERSRTNRDAVIAAHMYLCKRGARKFRRAESDPADLEQVAAIGLVKATDAYRAERTTPFEAYAWIVIVGELMHYARDCERAIRVPRWLRSVDRRYVSTWERLAAREHAEPTPHQLALELEVSIDVVDQLHALRRTQATDMEARTASVFDAIAAPARGLSVEERLTISMAVENATLHEKIEERNDAKTD